MIAAGGPAGNTRVTFSGIVIARPVASVTVAARNVRGIANDADRPASSERRVIPMDILSDQSVPTITSLALMIA